MEIHTYAVHQNPWPFFLALAFGWAVILAGTLRWGLRFAAAALPVGLLIPASFFLIRPGLWRGLLDPETAAWNAAYWLIPAALAVGMALGMRRRRTR